MKSPARCWRTEQGKTLTTTKRPFVLSIAQGRRKSKEDVMTSEQSLRANAIREKQRSLRAQYGSGYLTAKQLAAEMGFKDRHSAPAWARSVGLDVFRRGNRALYEVDQLAKILVDRREPA